MSYTKLAKSILTSTVWMESDHTRIVWLTMLAMADRNGEVMASLPGLAHAARVPTEACEEAIAKFLSPDPYSRTKCHEGRRIQVIRGGWFILNHDEYRRLASDDDRKEKDAERQARHRALKRDAALLVARPSRQISQAEEEADSEEEAKAIYRDAAHPSAPTPAARGRSRSVDPLRWTPELGWDGISDADRAAWSVAYPAVDQDRQLAAADQWLRANPAKAKKSLWRKFLSNWLSRQQERGTDIPASRPAKPAHDVLAQLARIEAEEATR